MHKLFTGLASLRGRVTIGHVYPAGAVESRATLSFDRMRLGLTAMPVAYLSGVSGRGMTAVLQALVADLGGHMLSASDYAPAIASGDPLAFDDSVIRILCDAVDSYPVVIADDLHHVLEPANQYHAPRYGLVSNGLTALCDRVLRRPGHRLVAGAACCLPNHFEQRGFGFSIPRFTLADYRFLLERWLDAGLARHLDVERIFRFAPRLDAHHLRACAEWWRHHAETHDTEAFIEVLRAQRLGGNVDLAEVQDVRLEDLGGVDDAVQTLLRSVVLPHENEALAEELSLRAKRGVLLYGPPGTGKTTVGRALAHRLKGKFFLIDGTFIAGTDSFYGRIQQVFQAAKDNAPSVTFIDDADAIFENRSERGLYRYLLTMIDGLESESNAQVTVMLTAMNLGDLPAALVRSGHVELWLEMALPDDAARRILLERQIARLPSVVRGAISDITIETTSGLTGADLKACVNDVKSLYAFDGQQSRPQRDLESYLLEAVTILRDNKEKYAVALQMAREQLAAAAGRQSADYYPPPPLTLTRRKTRIEGIARRTTQAAGRGWRLPERRTTRGGIVRKPETGTRVFP